MTPEEKKAKLAFIEKAVNTLIEHFDTVQILCTVQSEDMTGSFHLGRGNWYARYGQMVEMTEKGREDIRIEERNAATQ